MDSDEAKLADIACQLSSCSTIRPASKIAKVKEVNTKGGEEPKANQVHRRRPRYSGRHPRAFHLKYKELNAERYPDTVEKVLASGKTPAGTHRPIMMQEVLELLRLRPGQVAVDATLGYGGHAREILRRIPPRGRLIALDADPIELPKTEARLRAEGFGADALTVVHSNFAGLARVLAGQSIEGADVILADLGLSSMQIDNPERGFTYKFDGPLDLRMNPNKGRCAAEFLAGVEAGELAELLRENADEPRAQLLAAAIADAGSNGAIRTTRELRAVVERALSGEQDREITLRRVFQALRIEVNDEFGALETFLRFLPQCLKTGGRVAILTFHSGEDRRVKRFFEEGLRTGAYGSISPQVLRPTSAEIRANPRSAPARLRWAERGSLQLP
jgi:16S rRNA (cytosine1402-N4)-methyltransferase